MNKYILVTGGLGFIGTNLILTLLDAKYTIVNIDIISYCSNIDIIKDDNYIFIKGDCKDKEFIKSVFEKYSFTSVINLCALTHVDRSFENPKDFFNNNISSTLNLLNILSNYTDIHFIHFSTDEVYGESVKRALESDEFKPTNPYSKSKAICDQLVQDYSQSSKIKYTILRPSNVYGPYQYPEKLIPLVIYRLKAGLDIPVYGNGMSQRSFLYVKDLAKIVIKVLKLDIYGIYNVSGPKSISVLETIKTIVELMNIESYSIKNIKDRPIHDSIYLINDNKLELALGKIKKTDFKIGIQETIEFYQNLDFDFSKDAFFRRQYE
jgi:dTDP-glucose 4,6-dehydratase